MSGSYKHALDRLETLSGDAKRIIYDPELNTLLDPLRRAGPIQVICGDWSCGQRVSWWALAPDQTAIVLSAQRRLMKKESHGLGGAYEFKDADPHPMHGLGLSEREAMTEQQGRKQVTLADNPGRGVTGVPTRRTFTCGKCGREYPRKNETMLREFVTAAGAGRAVIRL